MYKAVIKSYGQTIVHENVTHYDIIGKELHLYTSEGISGILPLEGVTEITMEEVKE